ncbi:5'-methylthioadenosine/adenosylhomocysteine nucleosidase [Arenibaculum pallidiluteum]|uniref:5'-methylthioadenosine/adenosylhomocysteine nucleosidase n=1 Tax=Arenibaculum pallidiluteum TaxID=2812559 RepID=UPI001A96BE38|nr:5'-methylthioadenosine/adenosylhomocysteine nucleosidase [Arenibaculum pallidiluteum]
MASRRGDAPIGLISAIPQEISHFGEAFQEADVAEIGGLAFRSGALGGRAAVLVEAGIGKVNAAIVSTVLCREFGARVLLFSGVAGGLDPALGIGDVVVARTLIQHDYGAMVGERLRTYQPGAVPLPGVDDSHGYHLDAALEQKLRSALDGVSLPGLSAAATGGAPRQPAIHFGTVVTGDAFVNCEATRLRLFEQFSAQAVEMEGAAVAQVAERFAVPCVVVRALSDLAGAESHMDFGSFVHDAAAGAAQLMRRIAAAL